MDESQLEIIECQPGPQTQFCECEADIVIFGGSAGGSKSFSIVLDLLRGADLPKYRALVLRRQLVDLTADGGFIDDARWVWGAAGGVEHGTTHAFRWPCGASIILGHMENARKDHLRYKSKQYAVIAFEELTEFEKHQFWYMPSRNRSACGLKPYIRATTNPEPGWVADLLIGGGYVDPKTGHAIPEMSGVIRYLIREDDIEHWFDTEQEAFDEFGKKPISFTFIRSKLEDNKKLLEIDPDYKTKLESSLGRVERLRLLEANWIAKPAAGLYFNRDWWHIARKPTEFKRICRAWDLAGSKAAKKGENTKLDYCAGVLMGITADKTCYILDVKHFKGTPAQVRERVLATANADAEQWGRVTIRIPQDPGQAGVDQADSYGKMLSGFRTKFVRPTGNKITRAEALSSQVEQGNVHLLQGPWNEALISEAEQFPDGEHDDIVDAMADAFNELAGRKITGGKNWST